MRSGRDRGGGGRQAPALRRSDRGSAFAIGTRSGRRREQAPALRRSDRGFAFAIGARSGRRRENAVCPRKGKTGKRAGGCAGEQFPSHGLARRRGMRAGTAGFCSRKQRGQGGDRLEKAPGGLCSASRRRSEGRRVSGAGGTAERRGGEPIPACGGGSASRIGSGTEAAGLRAVFIPGKNGLDRSGTGICPSVLLLPTGNEAVPARRKDGFPVKRGCSDPSESLRGALRTRFFRSGTRERTGGIGSGAETSGNGSGAEDGADAGRLGQWGKNGTSVPVGAGRSRPVFRLPRLKKRRRETERGERGQKKAGSCPAKNEPRRRKNGSSEMSSGHVLKKKRRIGEERTV